MSKMQEAFDKKYGMPWKHAPIDMCEDFEAGYQAAIAAVKEGGPFLIVAYDEESGVCEIRDVANPHNRELNFVSLYTLSEDTP